MNCDSQSSGIYKITCLDNGRFYVGSAVNFRNRCSAHKSHLINGTHRNKPLQNAWDRYGQDSFIFEIMEEVPKERLLVAEQEYLDKMQPFERRGYNILKTAGSLYGHKHSNESRKKMSSSAKNRKSPSRFTRVDQFTVDGEYLKTWDTIKEVYIHYGAKSRNSVLQVLDHPRWLFRGFRWKRNQNG